MNHLQHYLTKLAEEGSEVAQIALKTQQFGADEVMPGQPLNNFERCHLELDDLTIREEITGEGMNTEIAAEKKWLELGSKEGWHVETKATILENFVREKGLMREFVEFARRSATVDEGGTEGVPDPIVKVRPVGDPDEFVEWRISQDLTDRWGGLNEYNAAIKPLDELTDSGRLTALRDQMWGESTFIVRKDGEFGILFEVEYCSQESEAVRAEDPKWYASLKSQAEVIKTLLAGMKLLAEKFPGVQFGVPDEANIIQNRPAAWAFVADGLLNEQQREELGKALFGL